MSWIEKSRETLNRTVIGELQKRRCYSVTLNKEWDFFVMKMPDWVNVVCFTPQGQLVLVRQFRAGTEAVELELPGGVIDAQDSTPLASGVRELLEETGYAGRASYVGSMASNPAIQNNFTHVVLVEDAQAVAPQDLDPTEDVGVVLLDPDEVEQLALTGGFRHALCIASLLLARRHIQER